MADDRDSGNTGEAAGHEHLRAVGDDALDEAGERVEDRGTFPWIEAETFRDILRQRSGRDDGDGIVGRAAVDEAHQRGDTQFCPPLAVDMPGQPPDDEFQTAVVADQFQHAPGQQRDDDEFAHRADAAADGGHPADPVVGARGPAEDTVDPDADSEDDDHVDPCEGRSDDEDIRNEFQPLHRIRIRHRMYIHPEQDIEDRHEQGGGRGNPQVGLELVLHRAALALGRRNRGVGDERKVVAEEGAADDDACHQGHTDAGFLGDTGSDRDQGDNRSHTGTDGHRDETGGEEEPRIQKPAGQEFQGEIDRRIDGPDVPGRRGKSACQDEDPDHQEDVLVAGPLGEDGDLRIDADARSDEEGEGRGDDEGGRDRYLVEVMRDKRGSQVDTQEHEKRAQRHPPADPLPGRLPMFCLFGMDHLISPFENCKDTSFLRIFAA